MKKPNIPEGATKSEAISILQRWLEDVRREECAGIRRREAELRNLPKPPPRPTRIVA